MISGIIQQIKVINMTLLGIFVYHRQNCLQEDDFAAEKRKNSALAGTFSVLTNALFQTFL